MVIFSHSQHPYGPWCIGIWHKVIVRPKEVAVVGRSIRDKENHVTLWDLKNEIYTEKCKHNVVLFVKSKTDNQGYQFMRRDISRSRSQASFHHQLKLSRFFWLLKQLPSRQTYLDVYCLRNAATDNSHVTIVRSS